MRALCFKNINPIDIGGWWITFFHSSNTVVHPFNFDFYFQTRIRQFEGNIRNGAIWDSLPITEKNSDVVEFNKLNEMVKINQFPAMHELGRKGK